MATSMHDFAEGDRLRQQRLEDAVYAIQCFSQAFRSTEFWEPQIIVRPTHAAVYRGATDAQLTHVEDIRYDQLDSYMQKIFDSDYDRFEDYFYIPYDERTGAAEWVPGVGPAPIWTHPTAARTMSRQEMAGELDKWIKQRWS